MAIKHKPITNSQYIVLYGKNPLTDLSLNTGTRIAEIHRLINLWNGKDDYIDIHTKYSGKKTNRIYLQNKAKENLRQLIDDPEIMGMSVRTLSRRFKAISESVGIEFTSHNLRATFATRLLELGVDLVTVSTLMNHSDISITAQYIQFSERKLRGALNVLNDYETYEGMSPQELMSEIYKLRMKLTRQDDMISELKNLIK